MRKAKENHHTTDELVDVLFSADVDTELNHPELKIIADRLRDADKLCEAAEGLVSSCTPELYDEYFEATKKAIANYKGK